MKLQVNKIKEFIRNYIFAPNSVNLIGWEFACSGAETVWIKVVQLLQSLCAIYSYAHPSSVEHWSDTWDSPKIRHRGGHLQTLYFGNFASLPILLTLQWNYFTQNEWGQYCTLQCIAENVVHSILICTQANTPAEMASTFKWKEWNAH